MNNVNIDTEALKVKIEALKIKRDKVKEIFTNIEKRINEIPDYYQSNTSESILNDFNLLYKEFSIINDSNDKYIEFLEYSNKRLYK